MASSIYTPLQGDGRQFRLLVLEPSPDRHAALQCGLKKVSFDDGDLEYTALSYTWGDPQVTTPILVNGMETQVTLNLEAALRHIRKSSYAVILWVDALCIDQNNAAEKNHQVEMMREIYSGAELVIVWLGSASEDSDLAMEILGTEFDAWIGSEGNQHDSIQEDAMDYAGSSLLNDAPQDHATIGEGDNTTGSARVAASDLAEKMGDLQIPNPAAWTVLGDNHGFSVIDDKRQGRCHMADQPSISPTSQSSSSNDTDSDDEWWGNMYRAAKRITPQEALALSRLLKRSWWSRIWVVQEVLLAKKVVFKCGNAEVAGVQMSNYEQRQKIVSVFSTPWADRDCIEVCVAAVRLLQDMEAPRGNDGAMDYLLRYTQRQATRPHDHIYGFFGIIPKEDQMLLGPPNYDCGVEDLFISVATKLMLRHNSLLLLLAAALTPRTAASSTKCHLPSWVPDWMCPNEIDFRSEREEANPFSEPVFQFSEDSKELMLECFEIDKIESVKPVPPLAQGRIPIWKSALETGRTRNAQESPPLQGVIYALLRLFLSTASGGLDDREGFELLAAFLQELEECRVSLGQDEADGVNSRRDYLAGFLEWTEERRDGRTDEEILEKLLSVQSAHSFVEWYRRQSEADLQGLYKRYSVLRKLGSNFSMSRTCMGLFHIIENAQAAPGDVLCVVPTCPGYLLLREVRSSKYLLIGTIFCGKGYGNLAQAARQGEIVKKSLT